MYNNIYVYIIIYYKALRAKRAGLSKPNWSEKLKNVKSEAKVPKSEATSIGHISAKKQLFWGL